MNKNETALEMCLRMFKERARYWFDAIGDDYEVGMCMAYYTAVTILEYAMQNNIECLQQFDCYHKEREEE